MFFLMVLFGSFEDGCWVNTTSVPTAGLMERFTVGLHRKPDAKCLDLREKVSQTTRGRKWVNPNPWRMHRNINYEYSTTPEKAKKKKRAVVDNIAQ